ncbi:MAG: menaquinone-dependent protoporphyrinogen IX dehydrogenase [Wenzhouxiangellaceae bacterium]|nr:menaquinone-dependent protoporphyrinogen IX dehydrogenase [Wenzhouxiangellaceae bacterium]
MLIAYFSGYGHTRKIAERLRERLAERGVEADTRPLDDSLDPEPYQRIVIGASIRNGKHKPPVHAFIRQHLELLKNRPSAFFSVNLVARKPLKNTPETNPYTKKFIEQSPWQPDLLGVFAGNLDYQRYTFSDRNIIRFIMWLTKGPTDPNTNHEFTDWDEVDRFAERLAVLGEASAPADAAAD